MHINTIMKSTLSDIISVNYYGSIVIINYLQEPNFHFDNWLFTLLNNEELQKVSFIHMTMF